MTTYPRGKPASPARPGKIIKAVLSGTMPLVTGEYVTEAAIVDIHNVYRDFIYEQNQTRPSHSKLKGMTYPSFLKIFKFAQLLGLVELVREEPMLFPPGSKHLYSVRKRQTDGMRVFATISKRRVFKLSAIGAEDDRSWTDLCRAWIQGWHAPEKIIEVVKKPVEEIVIEGIEGEGAIPQIVVEEAEEVTSKAAKAGEVFAPPGGVRGRGRPKGAISTTRVKKAPASKADLIKVPILKLQIRPSKEQYVMLLKHLKELDAIGISNVKVQKEVDKLSYSVGEWVAETIELLQNAVDLRFPSKIKEFRELRDVLTAVDEGLLDRDIAGAIKRLEKLV